MSTSHDVLVLNAPVTADRMAVTDVLLLFRVLESGRTATVDSVYTSAPGIDALFSFTLPSDGPVEEQHLLRRGQSQLVQPLLVVIRNDFVIEDEECFTIRLMDEDVHDRPQFTCNDDDTAIDFFCEHTICITDDDGKYYLLGFFNVSCY